MKSNRNSQVHHMNVLRATAPLVVLAYGAMLGAQPAAASRSMAPPESLSLERIFKRGEFRSAPLPSPVWLNSGTAYLDMKSAEGGGTDIVRVDLRTGVTSVVVPAARLTDGNGKRIDIEDIVLSPDETKAIVFHDVVSVFRHSRRGTHHLVDLASGRTWPVSKSPGRQLLAKFAPDGRRISFVRDNDLWLSDPVAGTEQRLTTDGSEVIINGTTDWVYEEEWGFYDAYRWSPDGTRIAFWRFDQSAVRSFPLVNERTLYPEIQSLRYPKAGEANARVKIGVFSVAAPANVTWMNIGGDTGLYVPGMEWVGNDSLVMKRVPRRQSRVDLVMGSAATGGTRVMFTDLDSAYVDLDSDAFQWVNNMRQFTWRSDRSGWSQLYLVNRNGTIARQITADGADVTAVEAVDEKSGYVWVQMAAPDPTQRQVFRYPLFKSGPAVRVTQERGSHNWNVSPGARWAIDVHSSAGVPPRAVAIDLTSGRTRVLESNAALAAKIAAAPVRRPEFFRIPMPDGTMLDAYRIVPANFDSTRAYPVLMYVYGGPAAPQVNDAWGGTRFLWHMLMAQKGYPVVVVDNRGAAWRGRDFRKVTQFRLGLQETSDQVNAARWLGRQRWVDASRIGIWGWSYGGYMTAMAAGLGGEVFRMGMAVAPVTDWRLYDTIYTERFMGTPQENEKGYRETSPLAHASGITANMLIVHGTGDDNVHPQNTLQFIDRMQALGKPFSMMLYPNRTHSISEGSGTQAHLYDLLTRFVVQNLGNSPVVQ
jgi:dipeptidyl-peptidase 4